MNPRPVLKLPPLPPWETDTCLLWPEWPAMDLSRGERTRFLSHRAGGHYEVTAEAKTILQENLNEKYSKRSAITTWLENERKQGVFAPEITSEVIKAADPEQLPSIDDIKRRVLTHFERRGLGYQDMLRDDRGLAETNINLLRNRPALISDLFLDASILAGSGCEDWTELGVIMDNLERTGYVKKILIADNLEWHNYSLTLEGLEEARRVVVEPGHAGPEPRTAVDGRIQPGSKDVFVIHGRNEEAREAIFDFLNSIGLDPIHWEAAVKETGQSSPYVGHIIDAGLSRAHAAVVILTPDDTVTLNPRLQSPDDPPIERGPAGQPRPNVFYEAGLAMSQFEDSTIIVEIGEVKRFSDIFGRHTIRLADTAHCREALANRLEVAGCPVDRSTAGWDRAGNFSAAIRTATECFEGSVASVPDETQKDAAGLLGHAQADEAHRPITKLATPYGILITSGPFTFGGNGDERESQRWEMALEWLLSRGLLEFKGASATGDQFVITPMGHSFLKEVDD